VGSTLSNCHEFEEFGSCAVLARVAVFNIVRCPHRSLRKQCKKARYVAELEPPSQYDHPYEGLVGERLMPVAETRVICDSLGASHSSADAPGGVACAWVSDNTCFIILPDDELAPVDTYRRHEVAHCNGWPADHPHD